MDHTTALVPLETWAYSAPALRAEGINIDIGLLAESLLYYDRVLINVATQPHLADLLVWLSRQRDSTRRHLGLRQFIRLLEKGVIEFYDYSFLAIPVLDARRGVYELVNVQDPIQQQPNTFIDRYLKHDSVRSSLPTPHLYERLINASRTHVTEVKASAFGLAINKAREDFRDPERGSIVLQRFVDELFELRGLGEPPTIEATIARTDDTTTVSWNIDLDQLKDLAGEAIGFHRGSPLAASIAATKLVWSTAELGCDLYLASPLSSLVSDKLFEGAQQTKSPQVILENLKDIVEFPDIRRLVNEGHMTLDDILEIRRKATRFRKWLQTEGPRDRDAIIAYHQEVARESGLTKAARRAVSLVTTLGGAVAGGVITSQVAGPIGETLGSLAGAGAGYVSGLASRLGAGWRPVVFGRWLEDRVRVVDPRTR